MFSLITGFHHVDFAFDAEQLAGKTQGTAPLTGAGFGRNALDTSLFVIKSLRNRRVGFVRTGWTAALVFVIGGEVDTFGITLR